MLILLISMDSLEPLQYGITYNKITKYIGNEVYESGRYIIGPTKNFIIYPANLVTIEFSDGKQANADSLKTRTAEGLAVSLHVSFQYKIIKKQIPKLYNLANINYHGTYVRIARDIILKVGGRYNATSYWQERLKISDDLKETLNKELTNAYATVEGFQILKIEMPKPYEDSIVQTQVEVQKTNMRKFEQTAELIRQNISVIQSKAEQTIKITNATGLAEAYRIKQYADATAINNTITTESSIYKNVIGNMTFNNSELTNYLFLTSLDGKTAKLLVGMKNAILSFGNSNQPASNVKR